MLIRTLVSFILLLPVSISGHPGHQDPVYAELNDYLMAIQIMRYDDPRAAEIFDVWNELREASWKIRELTDDSDLLITSSKVMEQIAATKEKQKKLLVECKEYFSYITGIEQHLAISVDQSLTLDWMDSAMDVQVFHTKVLLIKIENKLATEATITMQAGPSDQILFWNKTIRLLPQSTRYTFLVYSPLDKGRFSNSLQIVDERKNRVQATIHLQGIPTIDPIYQLSPGEFITKVIVPNKQDGTPSDTPDFSNKISFNITDSETGQLLPARARVIDEEGKSHWFPLNGQALAISREAGWKTTTWEHQPGPYFYLNGKAILGVEPKGKKVTISHGYEFYPQTVEVPNNGEVDLALARWINMPQLGWYAGHTHIHTTDVGIPVQFSRYWPLVSQAEDLHVSAILSLKGEWISHAIYANEYPMGVKKAFSTSDYITVYGEEYRSNPYGHLAFIGLKQLIQPISSGALGELGGPDYPSNATVLDEALAQGANTIAAHFGNFTKQVTDIKSPWPSTGFEMPVDIALGKIELAEIYGNGGQMDVWYDILNCGFRIPATAGPDWVIKDSPRVYVFLGDQPFNFENWRGGLQEGRSFITKGPMLFFEAEGKKPGSELELRDGANQVQITAEAKIPEGFTPVEIVFNGEVIYTGSNIDTRVTIEDSGWLVARCEGAHSNPIWVNYEGKPVGFSKPALKFIEIINRLEQWVSDKALFYDEAQKKEVLSIIEEGKLVYERIVATAKEVNK